MSAARRTPHEEPELPRQLTHALFDLSSAVDQIGRTAASRLGINQTDLICLNLLASEGPMGPGRIAAALGLTPAAISAMATRLEAGGYATREMDPSDRRRVVLRASPTGAERAFGYFNDLYDSSVALGRQYPEKDLRRLVDCILRFADLVDQAATHQAPAGS